MQDLTLCPSCRLWKESLRVMPCCKFKFCDECIWKTGGCVRCENSLDFNLLRVYKPIDALIKECLTSCRFCGELHTQFMIKSHEGNCPKTPLNELVKDMNEEIPPEIAKTLTTEQDLRNFYVRKNLINNFQQMIMKYTPTKPGEDGFINHVVADTDTLSGIALRYGVSVNELRKANHLVGNTDQALYKLIVLRVPVKANTLPAQDPNTMDAAAIQVLKRRMIGRFIRVTGCQSVDEAEYYLEQNNFNYDLAKDQFTVDQKVSLPTPPATISSTYVPQKKALSKTNRRCCFVMG